MRPGGTLRRGDGACCVAIGICEAGPHLVHVSDWEIQAPQGLRGRRRCHPAGQEPPPLARPRPSKAVAGASRCAAAWRQLQADRHRDAAISPAAARRHSRWAPRRTQHGCGHSCATAARKGGCGCGRRVVAMKVNRRVPSIKAAAAAVSLACFASRNHASWWFSRTTYGRMAPGRLQSCPCRPGGGGTSCHNARQQLAIYTPPPYSGTASPARAFVH